MTLELRILSGGRAGEVRRFTEADFEVGRAEGVGLRLDPESDLHVSARHARLERRSDGWWIHDLESRNGTWVDGTRIVEPHPLRPGARVRFGWEGPEVEVLPGAAVPPAHADVHHLTRRNRALAAGLVIVVFALAGVVALSLRTRAATRTAWERERAELIARTDSLMEASRGTVSRLEGEVAGLAEALESSRRRVAALQIDLGRLGEDDDADPDSLARLREQLQVATAALTRQQVAASLDAATLTSRVRPAVTMVFVEFDGGQRSAATGFAVGTDGRIVTNRHVVAGASGLDRPVRLGVQFSGSPQVWPADLERTDEVSDLALLRVRNLVGGNPAVPGINTRTDTLAAGAPVLLLGFPYATPGDDEALPRALSTAGVLMGHDRGRMEIQGWGAEGASGSPVFDATGRVAGVLFGAAGEGDERRLVAVPASALLAFLDDAGP